MKSKLLLTITVLTLLNLPNVLFGQAPPLGVTSGFAVFTAVGAFTNVGATMVTGDIGTNVGAFTGFPPGILIGTSHVADPTSAQAAIDVDAAYGFMSTITCGAVLGTTLGSGQILTPNVYCLGAASTLNGNLILDAQGDPNALFIFKIDGAMATGSSASVSLVNSASLQNVYWQVNGEFTLGGTSTFLGTLITNGAITLLGGSSLTGRALSRGGAISLNANIVDLGLSPIPSVITANGPTTFCAGGSVILSGNVGGVWNTGAVTPSITVTTSGDYYVTNGTAVSNHIIVTVNPLPTPSVITANGPTSFCSGGNVVLSGNIGGIWSNGLSTPSITVTTGGDYFVTNSNGCGSVTSNHIIVTISPLPVASVISANGPTTFCAGGNVVLSGNISGIWSNGLSTPSITVTTGGDYFVTNSNGCGSVTSNHIIVTISPLPVASVITANGPTTFCAGSNVFLSGNNGGTWSNNETTPSITASIAGDYFVTNSNGCGSITSNHILVTVNPLPVASVISANGPTTFCAGSNVFLSGNNGGTWSNNQTTPSITASTAGDYYVTNTTVCGSIISNHIIVTVNPLPVASVISANGPTTFCDGGNVLLSGNIGGTWSNSATTPSITVSTAGDYFVTNTTVCGSITSNHILITVNPLPVASVLSANGPTTFCPGGNVLLSGNIGGTWSNSETTPSITVSTAGDYFVINTTVCGSITSNHILITINPLPVASILSANGPTTFCAGSNVLLSGNVGGTWSNNETTPSITVSTAGDYFVTNTTVCGSITSNHILITVNPLPVASIISANGPTTFCADQNVILSGNVGGTWSNSETTPSITVNTAGDYFVTNTTVCGSITSNHILITVNPLPVASVISASGPTSFCEGGSVILTGNTGGIWNNTAITSSITVSSSGDYFVTNTNICGSINSNHILVTVNPLPFALTGSNVIICSGNSVTLGVASIPGHTYSWTPGTGLSSANISDPTASPTITTTYTLVETITATSCQYSNSVTVTVNYAPVITAEPGNLTECKGSTASFTVSATGTSLTYQWRNGNVNLLDGGNISGANTPTLIINPLTISDASSNYNVVVSGSCLPAATSVNVSLVIDNGPILLCPSNVTQNTCGSCIGQCSAFVLIPAPQTQNTCTIASILNNHNNTSNASGIYPVGTTIVTWIATDIYGNTVSCQQSITVIDVTPPVISCPPEIVINTDPGSCFGTILFLEQPQVSDNCTVVSVTNNATTNYPIGSSVITWTATDLAGNTAVCYQLVSVVDNILPSVICPSDLTIIADTLLCYASNFNLGFPVSFDNCAVISVSNNAPSILFVGNHTITWTVADAAGNSASCPQQILVTESNPPFIQAPPDIIVSTDPGECFASELFLGNPTVSDQCNTPVVANNAPDIYPVGTTLVVWTATDLSGNTSRSSQTVTVNDTEHPMIICPLNMVVPMDTNVIVPNPQVSDNCGIASITNNYNGTANASGNYPPGSTNVIFTVTDIHGNSSTCNTIVTVDCQLIAQNDTFYLPMNNTYTLVVTSNDLLCGQPISCNNLTILHQPAYVSFFVQPGTAQITYTPFPGHIGIDSMQYQVCCEIIHIDDQGYSSITYVCDTAWVFVYVNQPPTAHISGSTTICTNGFANLVLTMTGIPPYTLLVSDGNTVTTYVGIMTNYFNIAVSPNVTTTYTIIQVTDATSLSAVGTGAAIITVFGPQPFILTGGGVFCPGTMGLPIGLTNSEIGIIYTLYLNGSSISGPVSGTGNPLNFGLYDLPGVYTVIAASPTYYCTYPMYSNAVITLLPAPQAYEVTGGGYCCYGCTDISVGLSNSDPNVWYQLYLNDSILVSSGYGTGGPLDFGYVTEGGIYTVVGSNSYGCLTNMTGQAEAIFWPRPDGNLVSPDQTICLGNSAQLIIDIYAGTAPWCINIFDGTVTTTYCNILCSPYLITVNPTQTTTYTLTFIKDTNNCLGFYQGSTTIYVIPSPIATLATFDPVCFNSNPINLNGGSPLGGFYTGPGVSGGTFDPAITGPGSFEIMYTYYTINGCVSNATQTITVLNSPVVSFTAMDSLYCLLGDAVLLTGNFAPLGSFTGNGILNNGDGTAYFYPALAGVGTHVITYTSGQGICYGSVSRNTTVTEAPLVYQITGGGSYCEGGPGVEVGLNTSQSGVVYQLIINGVPTSNTLSGTGSPISFGYQTVPGVYAIRTLGIVSNCDVIMNGTVNVYMNLLPVVTFNPLSSVCLSSAPVVLIGGNPAGGHYMGPGVDNNIFYPSLTGVGTFNIAYIYTNNDQCTNYAVQQITVTPCLTFVISGQVTYNNIVGTPMNNIVVSLKQNNNLLAVTTTNTNGFYQFTDLNPGVYEIDASSTKPWGGVNSADALLIMEHYVGIHYLSGLNLEAADVNNQTGVNATDALLVVQRFVSLINYFPSGDWTFDKANLIINNANLTYDFNALCYGDVNGTYLPPSVKLPATMNLNLSGTTEATSYNNFRLPIRVSNSLTLASLSLVLNYPSEALEVTSVQIGNPNTGHTKFNTENNQLRVSWYDLNQLTLSANDDLIWINFRTRNLSELTDGIINLSLDVESEASDLSGQAIPEISLTYPRIILPNPSLSVQIYPNPISDKAEFVYSIPEDAVVTLILYDILGNTVRILTDGQQQKAGTYQSTFDASLLPQGVYNYKLIANGNQEQQKSGRLIIAR